MPSKDKIYYCPDCGKELKGRVNKDGIPRWKRCYTCSRKILNMNMEANPHWKGGRSLDSRGYVKVLLTEASPYFAMVNSISYVLEHRLVMAEQIGRCLRREEVVHHKNGVRDDNRIENLELISRGNHTLRTMFCDKCELKKEVRLLQWHIKEQNEQIKLLTSKLLGV